MIYYKSALVHIDLGKRATLHSQDKNHKTLLKAIWAYMGIPSNLACSTTPIPQRRNVI